MRIEMVMPQMGESITESKILKWKKKVGDRIEKDENILEISTDKVDAEVPSPASGILVQILVEENQTVPVKSVIAYIETDMTVKIQSSGPKPGVPASQSSPVPAVQAVISPPPKMSGLSLIELVMPQMGESITESKILKWKKKVGDKIEKDENIVEISTDKVDAEVPSPASGVLAEILVNENEVVPVKTVIARISTSGVPTRPLVSTTQYEERPHFSGGIETTKITPHMPPLTAMANSPAIQMSGDREGRGFYSPLVRNIARLEDISNRELEMITGTGHNGRVTKKDLLGYVEMKKAGKVFTPASRVSQETSQVSHIAKPQLPVGPYNPADVEIIQMDNMRKSIADHMRKSLDTSAHVYSVAEADMSRVVLHRERNMEAFERREGFKLTYTPYFVLASVKALKDFPMVNVSVDGDQIIRRKNINIGVAVAIENGLIVPVIKRSAETNFLGYCRTLQDLANRARARKLMPEDVQGGTFTITNPGIFGNLFGLPVINQPQCAILGIGAIKKRVVVINDAIAIRPMMYLSLSYDHRVIDGALGGQFLQRVVKYLEEFDLNLVI